LLCNEGFNIITRKKTFFLFLFLILTLKLFAQNIEDSELSELKEEYENFSLIKLEEISWNDVSILFTLDYECENIPSADMIFLSNSIMILKSNVFSEDSQSMENRFFQYTLNDSMLEIMNIDSRMDEETLQIPENLFEYINIDYDNYSAERISMQTAFDNNDGACAFRALLGIAETRVGRNLTLNQLVKAREMYYGSTTSRNWWVNHRRADGKIQGSNGALTDVINIGFELLNHNEKAIFIRRISGAPDATNIPAGTEATFVRVRAVSTSNFHYLEGDANGNMIYDPLHALSNYINRPINRFDAIGFYTPD